MQVPSLDKVRMGADESGLSEELNLLFAGHEIVSDTTQQMIEWFMSAATAAAAPQPKQAPANTVAHLLSSEGFA